MNFNIYRLLIILAEVSALIALPINATTSTTMIREILTTTHQSDPDSTSSDPKTWLVNSAILSLGISPIRMNPVCYTGNCQSNGYGLEIFKFSYKKIPVGTCTNKIIPEHVTLTCIESSDVRAKTEKISNFDELKESYAKRSSSSAGMKLGLLSFQYGESDQTTRMVDDIYFHRYTLFYTYAIRSLIKLTSNIQRLELSDAFRDAITNMPCCVNITQTEEYIKDKIFAIFGYGYSSEIELGGIAQVLTTIEETQIAKLEQDGYSTNKEVGGGFFVSFGKQDSEEYNRERYRNFTRYVKNVQATTMGGEPFDAIGGENEKENGNGYSSASSKLLRWMQSVSQNPTVIKFNTLPITDLLDSQRFPTDSQIIQKHRAIQSTLNKFSSQMAGNCIRDCSGNGDCLPPAPDNAGSLFNIGTCRCDPNFIGIACSIRQNATTTTIPSSLTSPFISTRTWPMGWFGH